MSLGIGALIALAGLLAGCGAAALRPHAPPRPSRPGQAGQRERARAYGHRLMAELRLPAGARPARWPSRIGLAMKPMLPAINADVVDVRALYRTGWSINAVDGFLTAQKPAGLLPGDAGQLGTVGTAPIGADYVDYNPKTTPRWIYSATLATAVVPAAGGGSLVRVDAQIAWYPPRGQAGHIDPHRYKAVTVSAPGPRQTSRPVTRTFTARAIVARLAALFNALPTEPDITINCPAMGPQTTYQMVFTPAGRQWPRIVASTSGCGIDTISVNGRQQPALHDVGALAAQANRLLGLGRRT